MAMMNDSTTRVMTRMKEAQRIYAEVESQIMQ